MGPHIWTGRSPDLSVILKTRLKGFVLWAVLDGAFAPYVAQAKFFSTWAVFNCQGKWSEAGPKLPISLTTEQLAVIKAPNASPAWALLSECWEGFLTGSWRVASGERHWKPWMFATPSPSAASILSGCWGRERLTEVREGTWKVSAVRGFLPLLVQVRTQSEKWGHFPVMLFVSKME